MIALVEFVFRIALFATRVPSLSGVTESSRDECRLRDSCLKIGVVITDPVAR